MKKFIYSWFVSFFGLSGSWKWAKNQMIAGKWVRCEHWSGVLLLSVDSKFNQLLLSSFDNGKSWQTSNHHLGDELFIDYVVVDPIDKLITPESAVFLPISKIKNT